MSPWQPRVHEALERSGRSRHTVRAHRQHVDRFVRCWKETSECPFWPQGFREADEWRHQLARRLYFANQGAFRTRDYEETMNRVSALAFFSNAVLV